MDAFIGMILPIPYMYAPQDWNYCGGQSLPVAQNQALYALLGTNYGGNTQNFNLPNLISRVMIGSNRMGAVPAPLSAHALAPTGGFEQAIVAHTHPATFNSSGLTLNLPTYSVGVTTQTTLLADTATAGLQQVPSPNAYLAAPSYKPAGPDVPVHLYFTGTPTATASLSGISSTSTASLTAAGSASISGSGAVTVGQNTGTANTLPPFLALSFIICMNGIFPMQPN